ncbi:CDP-alcohol phosphatidyltransferase family protein [Sandaracinobacteroides saxicola]|uniref:Phosphatidylcholine/phosphatidylserine synthase n=1 Tax=Sandaracinobacteroides saxicola TaxID=2759707 RepID=A0A7G5ILB1_9SPHN|nr:phosphatidylcholine/phosphatidylserine synthase [Sandaracinobacteroides saxicola]QMW24153.1 phosphatidylcholine/phosphatidylserine synthase [Sandaracinobacteroides saxicola]
MERDPRARLRLLPYIPMRALVPNAITMLALCAGATGVRFAIAGQFDKAVAAVVIAGVLDGLDGRVARALKGTSRFGAELDSLSDVTAFGIAPALILYLWALQHLGGLGWVIALAHAVCAALRLARFNAALDVEDLPHKRLGFLTGIPAPAAAGLALSPICLSLGTGLLGDEEPMLRAVVVGLMCGFTAIGMVSTLPTWGFKAIRLPREARLPLLAGVGLFAAALAQEPWLALTAISVVYLLAMPFAWMRFRRLRAAEVVTPPDASPPPA